MKKYMLVIFAFLSISITSCTMQREDGSTLSWGPSTWGAQAEEPTYKSACPEVEIIGIYGSRPVAGISKYSAKIRNNSNTARVVGIKYKTRNPSTRRYEPGSYSSNVGAGAIKDFDLNVTSKPPKDVEIVSCK